MREILFKAISEVTNDWIEGDLCHSFDGTVCAIGNLSSDMHRVNPETICQFTGLTDKNGKKIFEGDLLHDGDEEYLIGWVENYASFCVDKEGWAFHHYFGESINPHEVEVIGNIHEKQQQP